jgi:hypothetical protein
LKHSLELLEGVWNCRDSFAPDSKAYGICLRAGVGYAAPAARLESEGAAEVAKTVETTVEPHRDRLTEPAAALFDLVTDGETDHDTDELRSAADRDDPELLDLERLAYADLLERLVDGPKPSTLYEDVIVDITREDAEFSTVVRQCAAAWSRFDEMDGVEAQISLRAGIILEAYREFTDDELPGDREVVFETARENRDSLSDAVAALFEYLDTGEAGVTPDELQDAANTEEPTLADLERITVAGLLRGLEQS